MKKKVVKKKSQRKVVYALKVTHKQNTALLNILSAHNSLYNKALQLIQDHYKASGGYLDFFDLCKYVTLWRNSEKTFGQLNAQSCQVTVRRVSLAMKAFFRRLRERKEKAGFPRFKNQQRFGGWGYKTHGDGWKLTVSESMKHGYIAISGIGRIRMRGKPRHPGIPKTAEVFYKAGKWYLAVTLNVCPSRKSGKDVLAVDWGTENFATLVSGKGTTEIIPNPRFWKKTKKIIKELQASIARCVGDSVRRQKLRDKLTKIYVTMANRRKDFVHKQANYIISQARCVITEELAIQSMTRKGQTKQKKGQNREILNVAPRLFLQCLEYKAEEAGIQCIMVPTKKVKPSQTCHECGTQEKKDVRQRIHQCPCGAYCHRDENSCKVMLKWAWSQKLYGQELSDTDMHPYICETPSILLATP